MNFCYIAVAIALALSIAPTAAALPPDPDVRAAVNGLERYRSLPLVFERRGGTGAGSTRFVARGLHHTMSIANDQILLAFDRSNPGIRPADEPVTLRFVGGNMNAVIRGAEPDVARIHRMRGSDESSREVDIPVYRSVVLSDIYPGIDIAFHGQGHEIEFDVIVSPGAEPSTFALHADGADQVRVDQTGNLVLGTAEGTLTLRRPVAWQDFDGEPREVTSDFALDGTHDVHLRIGSYDRTRTLVIDPIVSYATFLGGNSFEQGTAIAVDAAGNAYVTGYTQSTDFPMVNALDRSLGKRGDIDVFVSKINAAGTALVWSTYIGGATGSDRAVGIAVDASGSVYLTGQTSGSDFPTTATAWQKATSTGGGFVTKLSAAGNAIGYSTYVANANPAAIAVDADGNAYVSGSAVAGFLTTPGALRPVSGNPAGTSGFVLKLNPTGSAATFATFIGGTGGDDATSIAVDARANVYVGGWTASTDFPVAGGYPSAHHGGKDAFIAKLDGTGARLVYSTLLGGALDDTVNAIALDAEGNAYVAGETYSWDFPVKGGFQSQKAGRRLINSSVGNAFVAKLAPTGGSLVYSSFLGGEVCLSLCQLIFGPQPQYRADAAYGIAVDASGHAHVTGIARSYTFPLVDSSSSPKQADNEDSAFVAKVSVSGSALLWSTFIRTGYSESDNHWTRFPPGAAIGVAVDPTGAAYVTGDADGASNFQPTAGAFQSTSSIGPAAVVVKFPGVPVMALSTSNPETDTQSPITLTATVPGPSVAGTVTFMSGATWIGSATLASNTAAITTKLPAGIHALSALLRAAGSPSDTPVLTQIVDVPISCN